MRQQVRITTAAIAGIALIAGCSTTNPGSTGNGVSKLNGRAILDQAYSTAKVQTGVHISGTGHCAGSSFIVDMRLRSDGYATGTISFPPDKISVIATPTTLFLNAPKSFWVANTSAKGAAQIGTKWVRSQNQKDSVCVRALSNFSDVLANFVQLPGAVTKQGEGFVLGKSAVTLSLPIATVFISDTGPALPIRVDSTQEVQAGGTQDGMSFGEWDRPISISLPSADNTIDATQIALK